MAGRGRRSSSKIGKRRHKFSQPLKRQSVPNELLHLIATFCDPDTFLAFGKTCKSLLLLINNGKCWNTIFVRELKVHGIMITNWYKDTSKNLSEVVKHFIKFLNELERASSRDWSYQLYPLARSSHYRDDTSGYFIYNRQPSLHEYQQKPQITKSELSQQKMQKLSIEFPRKTSFNSKDSYRQFRNQPPNTHKFSRH